LQNTAKVTSFMGWMVQLALYGKLVIGTGNSQHVCARLKHNIC